MAVQRTRKEEEELELEALRNNAFICEEISKKMEAALALINGIDEEEKKKQKK